MGHMPFEDVPDFLVAAAELLLDRAPVAVESRAAG